MYLGRYQLGEYVPLRVLCLNGSQVPADPDACPLVDLRSASGKPVSGEGLPVLDKHATTGLFGSGLYLDEAFSEGAYSVQFTWLVGGTLYSSLARFQVAPGGGASGQVIAMCSYERPHARFLVQQRTSGRIYKGRNPRR